MSAESDRAVANRLRTRAYNKAITALKQGEPLGEVVMGLRKTCRQAWRKYEWPHVLASRVKPKAEEGVE